MKKITITLFLVFAGYGLLLAADPGDMVRSITGNGSESTESVPEKPQLAPALPSESNNTVKPAGSEESSPVLPVSGAANADQKQMLELPAPEPEDRILLETALHLYASGEYDSVLRKVDTLGQNFPQSQLLDQARVLAARALMAKSDGNGAIKRLSEIKPTSGEFPQALYLRGQILAGQNNRQAALEEYYRLAATFPDHALADDALLHMATLSLQNGHGSQAMQYSLKIAKSYAGRETEDDAIYMIGRIFETDQELRDPEKARLAYRAFIRRAESGSEPHFSNSPLLPRVRRDLQNLERTLSGVTSLP